MSTDATKYYLYDVDNDKTISLDTTEADTCKFTLGRGEFLNVTEAKVSRNHAELCISNNSVTLKPLAKNPTFFYETTSDDRVFKRRFLPKDQEKILRNGDKFSLLPDTLIYQVKIESPKVNLTSLSDTLENPIDLKLDSANGNKDDSSEVLVPESVEPNKNSPPVSPEKATAVIAASLNDSGSSDNTSPRKRRLPDWVTSSDTTNKPGPSGNTTAKPTPGQSKVVSGKTTVRKRIKLVDSDNDSESSNDKAKGDSGENNIDDTGNGNQSDDLLAVADVKSPDDENASKATAREKCLFGKSCYRKNPNHRQDVSHPGDSDFSDSEDADQSATPGGLGTSTINTPECPYGTRCYRRNTAHRAQFRHSAGAGAGTAGRTPGAKTGSLRSDQQQDDSYDASYDYDDSFIDDSGQSYSESESGQDDDSASDYEPDATSSRGNRTGNRTPNQGGGRGPKTKKRAKTPPPGAQGERKSPRTSAAARRNYVDSDSAGGASTDDEDIQRLIKESKRFQQNPKLQKPT